MHNCTGYISVEYLQTTFAVVIHSVERKALLSNFLYIYRVFDHQKNQHKRK